MDTKTKVVLRDDQLDAIKKAIDESENACYEALAETWAQIIGREEWDELKPGSLKPWDWSLPKVQVETILTWMGDKIEEQHGRESRVHALLDWMNKGPSADEG